MKLLLISFLLLYMYGTTGGTEWQPCYKGCNKACMNKGYLCGRCELVKLILGGRRPLRRCMCRNEKRYCAITTTVATTRATTTIAATCDRGPCRSDPCNKCCKAEGFFCGACYRPYPWLKMKMHCRCIYEVVNCWLDEDL
ncbi:unnamed protein product [Cylicocyclus nassatus]|uniref:Uncharacterized protein n=1 Tax=Cylicocyclus nassatus TaxID=53992 RepID=A0AA36M200_CYLNA|nr:unnamed protein product [Cylicocyclus nassatus]